ncbi:hypothetical protein [Peterkaempfera sp. SMS 1(5)a]|uniref:hypothetical protein n=1 Tax=Peterkaempfera podocarpi TaxID=3232308 RepID=UPI00366BF7AC
MSSRDSDKASPSPRRTGADAYPSGTPPYGIPQATGAFGPDGLGPGGAAEEPAPEDGPRTETTLTTRIRINIPGSRPIPPVVVRSPVKESGDEPAADTPPAAPPGPEGGSPRRRAAGPASPVLGVMDAENRTSTPPNLPPEWQVPEGDGDGSPAPTDGWFRPRKKSGPATPAGGTATGAPVPAPAPPASGDAFTPPPAPGLPAFDEPVPAPRRDGGLPRRAPAGGPGAAARPGGPGPQAPLPGGAPASPFAPGTATGPTPPPAPGPLGQGPEDTFPGTAPASSVNPFPPGLGVRSRPAPGQGGEQPFDNGFRPDYGSNPFGPPGADDPFGATEVGGIPPVADAGPGEATAAFPAAAFPAADPFAADPFAADPFAADPFAPDPFAAAPTEPAAANPFATGFRDEDFRAPVPPAGARPSPAAAAAGTGAADSGSAPAPRRRRGGKLVGYAIGAVVCAGGVAYGAGLMLNQADVPKGTTVLGTDIGGSSRDAAVHTLDATVAKIGRQPVQLRVGDRTVQLDATAAGLSFDTTATVDGLTHHSYNPVNVIRSLTGSAKAVAPVVKIDQPKLRAALQQQLAQGSGGPREGYVYFSATGKPVVMPPTAGSAVDIDAAVAAVQQSYQARALGRRTAPISLKVTAAQPKVSAAALQSAANTLGKKIINGGFVYVRRGTADAPGVPFGTGTFTAALVLAPDANGTVAPRFNLAKLQARLNGAFTGYRMKHGATVGPVTTQDVADAILSGLNKTGAARTVTLPVTTG